MLHILLHSRRNRDFDRYMLDMPLLRLPSDVHVLVLCILPYTQLYLVEPQPSSTTPATIYENSASGVFPQ